MCDTTNLSYERMKAYGKTINLPLFTTVYNHEVGHLMKTGNNNKEIFLRYLGIANVSIFSWFDKLELREEKTEVTEEEKYVVVGKKVNKNTYITSKVKFKKDDKGIYRLNLLELLKLREKILYQSYNYYVKMHRLKKVQGRERTYETTNVSQPKDILLDFLENRGNTEHQLKELMYNTQKK
jgi:hypothetical protein